GRAVARKRSVRHLQRRYALGGDLLRRLAEGERLRLREEVRHEQGMVLADLVERAQEADEVARDQLRALVDELVEGVLAVRARLTPDDRARLIVDRAPLEVDALAVGLHVELLQIRGEAGEIVAVRQDRQRLGPEEIVVPDAEQRQQDGQVPLERRAAEVLVHRVRAGEE